MLKNLLIAACLAAPLCAFAADAPKKELTPQQTKMGTCNKDAAAKKLAGDERKKFMSECLSADKPGPVASPAQTAQQEKMKTCNKDAGAKKLAGDDRKKFMSTCLKG